MVQTRKINISTQGNCHVIDITDKVRSVMEDSGLTEGTIILFHVGSTGGLTTVEYEPGLAKHDLAAAFERIAPRNARYEHEQTWHDDNGHAHVAAALLGPSLAVPFENRQLLLGTWQQIILIDFDTRPRNRTVICQLIG